MLAYVLIISYRKLLLFDIVSIKQLYRFNKSFGSCYDFVLIVQIPFLISIFKLILGFISFP